MASSLNKTINHGDTECTKKTSNLIFKDDDPAFLSGNNVSFGGLKVVLARAAILYAESVMQHSPGLPASPGNPGTGSREVYYPERVGQIASALQNPFRVRVRDGIIPRVALLRRATLGCAA